MSMEDYLKNLLVYGIIILLMSYVMKGFYVDSLITAILVAFVISLLNTFIKPVIEYISLPITFLTLGIFKLVINGFILFLADLILGSHFEISSVLMAVLSAIVMSLLSNVVGAKEL